MPVQVCASPEIKHPVVVQDISPLRSPLYVSAVMSCYVTALTPCYTTYSAQVFCMSKDRLCTFSLPLLVTCFYPILLMRACVFARAQAGCPTSPCCMLIVLGPHSLACWKYANNCPRKPQLSTPIVPTLKSGYNGGTIT